MENLPTISDFATLKWPHFDHSIWPHPNDKSAYPVAAKPVVVMGECGTGKTHLATCAWPRAGRN